MPTIPINTHIQNWIDKSTPDYYMMFIRAWIPYNAWYMHNFYDEDNNRTRDSEIIEYIKSNSNRYRDKIISFLNDSESESSKIFFSYLSKLHYELEQHPIPNFEKRLSFRTTSIANNTNRSHRFFISPYTYTANFNASLPKTAKRWVCEVIDSATNTTKHRIELFKWSISELDEESNFKAISDRAIANNIKSVFHEINPSKPTDIVIQPTTIRGGAKRKPNNSITIDSEKHLYFVDDKLIVAKVLIQLIYELRCKLFHGELDPTSANQGVYEQAYHIQNMLIKELR